MNELKTLKDLYSEMSTWNMGEMVSLKDLKAEAVKWVEESEELGELRTASWIRHFFNLTEEDLK